MNSTTPENPKRDLSPSKDKDKGDEPKDGAVGKKKKGGRKPKVVKEVELTEEQKAEQHQKWIEERCTRLRFLNKDGTRSEHLFQTRLEHYSELQRMIATLKPKCPSLFVCQFEDGTIMTSKNFKSVGIYRAKELDVVRPLIAKFAPRVDARWDFLEYHAGPPPGWKDKLQEKYDLRDKAKNDAILAAKQEEEAREFMERLENGGEPDREDNRFDNL